MAAHIAEDLAQARSVNCKDTFFDECAGPDLFQQLALRDQASGLTDEGNQHVISFGADMNGRATSLQPAFGNVEREFAESVLFPFGYHVLGKS